MKLQTEEKLNAEDWNDLLSMGVSVAKWLIQNTQVKVTTVSEHVSLQPKSNSKKRKPQKG